jgi:hypothetical protein
LPPLLGLARDRSGGRPELPPGRAADEQRIETVPRALEPTRQILEPVLSHQRDRQAAPFDAGRPDFELLGRASRVAVDAAAR